MSKPTAEEVDIAIRVIEWLQADTEENEPYAVNLIEACDMVKGSMPDV